MDQESKRQLYNYLAQNAFIYIDSDFNDKIDFRLQDIIEKEDQARQFIDIQKQQQDLTNPTIIGTLFGKKHSVLGMGLYVLMVQHGIMIDLRPEKVGIKLEEGKSNAYYIEEEAIHHISDLTEEEFHKLIRVFILEHLQPLFAAVAKASKSKASHLHSLVSHNLHQRSLVLGQEEGANHSIIQHYLDLLTSDQLFDNDETNPLQFTFQLHTPQEGDPMYIRKHCCLSYLAKGGDKSHCCGTCPHLF
ncbi:IucA/IucC family C-terminal-domain containing protein [Pontibacillus yanchengensis]|uniref:Uncharacterized protein n=1 Tax=Pontibacillus yanchengensis Y32 TaxID=1385514 RepID=A0A0A2TYH8_9BACI|nr:IucA/IucC family C-terminal-domain containing protein [Pontibacillus yanchengensis]KGP74295.1 hypothetical protein N782_15170 [Pontibacillus yanchengensis Y32]